MSFVFLRCVVVTVAVVVVFAVTVVVCGCVYVVVIRSLGLLSCAFCFLFSCFCCFFRYMLWCYFGVCCYCFSLKWSQISLTIYAYSVKILFVLIIFPRVGLYWKYWNGFMREKIRAFLEIMREIKKRVKKNSEKERSCRKRALTFQQQDSALPDGKWSSNAGVQSRSVPYQKAVVIDSYDCFLSKTLFFFLLSSNDVCPVTGNMQMRRLSIQEIWTTRWPPPAGSSAWVGCPGWQNNAGRTGVTIAWPRQGSGWPWPLLLLLPASL